MDTTKALQLLPAKVRQLVYVVLGVASSLLAAAGAFFLASPYPVPWWIGPGLAAVGLLAAPFAAIAASNVTRDDAVGKRAEVDDQGVPVFADEDPPAGSS